MTRASSWHVRTENKREKKEKPGESEKKKARVLLPNHRAKRELKKLE